MVLTQFGNMADFHTNNFTWYKYLYAPSISNLINYINDEKQTKIWLNEIKDENVDISNYLNPTNHFLLITPYIYFNNIPIEIKKIIENLEIIDNLWLSRSNLELELESTFNYRSINIIKFIKNWNNVKISSDKDNKLNEEIINLTL